MNFYRVEPEVAGELGAGTVYLSTFPTVVSEMEYLFDRWPSDELVQAHPCFAVSGELKELIESSQLTGYKFSNCKVGTTSYFEGDRGVIPPFYRIEPIGSPKLDDFALDTNHHLVVSEEAKRILERFKLLQCDFSLVL